MVRYSKLLFVSIFFLVCFLIFPNNAGAFVQSFFNAESRWVVNKTIEAITVAPDNSVYVSGGFLDLFDAQSSTINQVHGWNLATQQQVAMPRIATQNGTSVVASDQAGGWFVAAPNGMYVMGSTTLRYLVHINSNSTVDLNFFPIVTGTISDIVVRSSTVYIGGAFRYVNNTVRDRLASLDFNGNLLSWAPGVNNNVYTMAIDPAGLTSTIFVGGAFTTTSFTNATRTRAAAFDVNGQITSWAPTITSTASTSRLSQIMLDPSGSTTTIFLAGTFNFINSTTPRNMFAAVDRDTGTTTSWAPNTSATAITVHQAMAMASNTIYISGSFTSVRGGVNLVTSTHSRIAAIDFNGDVVDNWLLDDSATPTGIIYRTNTLYVFDSGGNTASTSVQAPRSISAVWGVDVNTLQLNTEIPWGYDPLAYSMDISGNTLMVNTTVVGIGNIKRDYIFAFDSSRNLKSFYPRLNGTVYAILVTTDTVYLGGAFTTSTGNAVRHRLAAFDLNGNLLSWAPRVNGQVNTLAMSPDGNTIYAGGSFTTTSDGGTRNRLAAFDRDGNTLSWNPGANSTVNQILLAPSSLTSSIFIAGAFTSSSVGTRNRLMAVDTNGSSITTFNPNVGSTVEAIAFDKSLSTSSLFFVGAFTAVSSTVTRNQAAAVDMNGKVTQWNPNLSSGTTKDLAVTTSSVFLAGGFTAVASTTRYYGAEVDKNAGSIKQWNPFLVNGASSGGSVLTLGPTSLYVGVSSPFFYFFYDTPWGGMGEYDLRRTGLVTTDQTVAESIGTINLEFMINATSSATSSMSYVLTGTATEGSDFTFSSGTVSFLPGVSTTSISLVISDDTTHESDETMLMTLSGADESYIVTSTFSLTITDNDVASGGGGYSAPLSSGGGGGSFVVTSTATQSIVQPITTTSIPAVPAPALVVEPLTIVVPVVVKPQTPKIVLKKNISLNQVSAEVRVIQKALNKLGFLVAKTGAGSLGKETMFFGPATRRAVVRFQESFSKDVLQPIGLRSGTGIVGPATLKKLNELLQK